MSELNAIHTVFASVDEMLAPEKLEELLVKSVTRVDCRPMDGHFGLAGAQLYYVETDAGRLVLKRMSSAYDWIMVVTDDHQGRSVRLWEYGLLDQLTPNIEHMIVACSRDGDGWAIVMRDLANACCDPSDLPQGYVTVFLDALAKIHATFWNDPRLEDPHLGLAEPGAVFNFLNLAKGHTGSSHGIVPEVVRIGWNVLEKFLDKKVFRHMVAIHDDPKTFINALTRYPSTLLHGDFRAENLALSKTPVVLDRQAAARSLMTIDLAWHTRQLHIVPGADPTAAVEYYRRRLEHYRGRHIEDDQRQAIVDIGFAVDALFATCFDAYFSVQDPDLRIRALHENIVIDRTSLIANSLRWL